MEGAKKEHAKRNMRFEGSRFDRMAQVGVTLVVAVVLLAVLLPTRLLLSLLKALWRVGKAVWDAAVETLEALGGLGWYAWLMVILNWKD